MLAFSSSVSLPQHEHSMTGQKPSGYDGTCGTCAGEVACRDRIVAWLTASSDCVTGGSRIEPRSSSGYQKAPYELVKSYR